MGKPRMQLQELLKQIAANVYFQPPNNTQMKYPCIIYNREATDTEFADNSPYRHTKRYSVTVIDKNPDSPIPDKVAQLPMCAHNRFFVNDGLNHDVFSLYF
ncbi:structural protein [Rhodococcus phage ReqiPepy6]|uniref:Structural protein n=1 Tax=Rhodococcus phage ReqiPepy6 TaxID=691965 RepID=D4P7D8_9CAUD|nr:structural protein [Rhodococcus phage ReqiPepy6]ADD80918.1 structural protein [Rhodococcus phage ReqiPepy6]